MTVVALVLAAGAAGCAAMQVHSYMPQGTNLHQFRTYAWASPSAFETGDPRLDNNTIFIDRLQSAVDQQLQRRGWSKVDAGDADLVIHYHARLQQQLEIQERELLGRGCDESSCGPFVYDAGTLLLDFVEARSQKLAWRGWAEGSLEGVVDDQAWLDQTLDKAVARIIGQLPS